MGQGGTIPAWAIAGAKVVCCTDGSWSDDWLPWKADFGPAKGEVCTIARAYRHWFFGARFVLREYYHKAGHQASEFRPVRTARRSADQDVEQHFKPLLDHPARTDAIVKIPHHGPAS